MFLDSLVVCVTRDCNMTCDHCLRGDSQKVSTPKSYIETILKDIDSIGILTFTGGEPTLNIEFMQEFFQTIIDNDISLSGFYLVTNGKKENLDFLKLLVDMYDYADDKETCTLKVSRDFYHEAVRTPLYNILTITEHDNKEVSDSFSERFLIQRGKALRNGLGREREVITTIEIDNTDEHDYISVVSTIYIGSTGEVLLDCDLPYAQEEKYSLGNITEKSLRDIINDKIIEDTI